MKYIIKPTNQFKKDFKKIKKQNKRFEHSEESN